MFCNTFTLHYITLPLGQPDGVALYTLVPSVGLRIEPACEAGLNAGIYTLVPSMGLRIEPACEAGLNAGIRRERVPPCGRDKRKKRNVICCYFLYVCSQVSVVRGKVLARDGSPLIGVRVSVVTQPLYGFTLTRELGLYVFYILLTTTI